MKRIAMAILVCVLALGLGSPPRTLAHNVWCHCPKRESALTIKFFHKSGDVYEALSRGVILQWHEANGHLEAGVLSEFDYKIDAKRNKLNAHQFKQALRGYEQVALAFETLDKELAELQAIDNSGPGVEIFEQTLTKILAESRPMERLSRTATRYADLGGMKVEKGEPLVGTAGILAAQRHDLAILRATLEEVLQGLRDALPLAEKGEFAQVMLSGRNGFGDKMPQFTDMMSAFERFYVRTCMATIATTMQVYPRGFEWLTEKKSK
jgi:hypothetical protein